MNSTSGSKRRKKEVKPTRGGLALGYEVLEIRDEGDEGESNIGYHEAIAGRIIADMMQNQLLPYRFFIPLHHIRVLRNSFLLLYPQNHLL
jgi:hypothetical protein